MSFEDRDLLIEGFNSIDKENKGYINRSNLIEFFELNGIEHQHAVLRSEELMSVMNPSQSGMIRMRTFLRSKKITELETHLSHADTADELITQQIKCISILHFHFLQIILLFFFFFFFF